MKKTVLICTLIVLFTAGFVHAEMKGHMMEHHGEMQGHHPCGMHPGMGHGMGPGMTHDCGMGPGMMMGRGMMGWGLWGDDEKEYQKALDATKDLRKELHMKMFEYREALRSPDTKRETVDTLGSDIRKLKRKILLEMLK